MRSTRPVYATLLVLLLTLFANSIIVLADEETDTEEYDVKARVVRISLLTGEVKVKRQGSEDWERARLNSPLVEGDTLSTEPQSRVEIQIDARNFLRIGSHSILKIVTLRDEGVALSIVEGSASLRLAKFDSDKEFFEVDAPKSTFAAEKPGLYRIDVGKDGRVRLTARDGGRARIYSQKSGFALRDGRTAELIIDGADAGEWEMSVATERDTWTNGSLSAKDSWRSAYVMRISTTTTTSGARKNLMPMAHGRTHLTMDGFGNLIRLRSVAMTIGLLTGMANGPGLDLTVGPG